LGGVIGRQASQLTDQLPAYQTVIARKLETLRSSTLGAHVVQKAADALEGLEKSTTVQAHASHPYEASGGKLMQVEVHEPPPNPVQIVQGVIGALFPRLPECGVVGAFALCSSPTVHKRRKGADLRPGFRRSAPALVSNARRGGCARQTLEDALSFCQKEAAKIRQEPARAA
jgi:hypothetical protein